MWALVVQHSPDVRTSLDVLLYGRSFETADFQTEISVANLSLGLNYCSMGSSPPPPPSCDNVL
jgi:hypothetical protein